MKKEESKEQEILNEEQLDNASGGASFERYLGHIK